MKVVAAGICAAVIMATVVARASSQTFSTSAPGGPRNQPRSLQFPTSHSSCMRATDLAPPTRMELRLKLSRFFGTTSIYAAGVALPVPTGSKCGITCSPLGDRCRLHSSIYTLLNILQLVLIHPEIVAQFMNDGQANLFADFGLAGADRFNILLIKHDVIGPHR
jgi:hypothetical protein